MLFNCNIQCLMHNTHSWFIAQALSQAVPCSKKYSFLCKLMRFFPKTLSQRNKNNLFTLGSSLQIILHWSIFSTLHIVQLNSPFSDDRPFSYLFIRKNTSKFSDHENRIIYFISTFRCKIQFKKYSENEAADA